MTGRTLAIGDVHGCDLALRTLIGLIAPTQSDTVVLLGDLVDRGPDTADVIEQVLRLQSRCRVILILGNHEEMMLQALDGQGWFMWMQCGGDEALESYGGDPTAIPERHRDLLESALDYWETPDTIFVHANLEHGIALSDQHAVCLRWTHLSGTERPFDPARRVICGHTPQSNGLPLIMPGWVCIDTDCQRGGWLTCLDVCSNVVYQASQSGETRSFPLGYPERS
ncbi:MAG TPA: metallophosphoesterase family protein [Planctomycetaceae bacterium]|nr:metallophosphoesterase family protein [Planctomycetaceae bacterium]